MAQSGFMGRARGLWEKNQSNWLLPLSKWDKLITGVYIILQDYADGKFPPTFLDQQKAFEAEIAIHNVLPGLSAQELSEGNMRKPFWYGAHYLSDLAAVLSYFQRYEVKPPARLLELGCGSGWMAECLALMGYRVVGTTISPVDIEDANKRIESLRVKGIAAEMSFLVSPMETVATAVANQGLFDCVFIYEALHHVFSWQEAIRSAYACLKPGGYLFLFNEPNLLHTCVSYRTARLSNTHEIGMSRSALRSFMRRTGFRRVDVLKHRFHAYVRAHWLAAQH